MESQQLKEKMSGILQVCQNELKRTTEIGKKMLSASKANSTLHSAYEELGQLVVKEINSGALKWEHSKVKEILEQIKSCESDLNNIEKDVQDIKAAASTCEK
jgi:pyruvate formate-lyase activating enzyme-like uncharacterized protein